MHILFADFPSVRLLLIILCIIGFVILGTISEATKTLLKAIEAAGSRIVSRMELAVSDGILQAEECKKAGRESDRARKLENRVSNVAHKGEQTGDTFFFTLDAPAVELLERLRPGSLSGWERINQEQQKSDED